MDSYIIDSVKQLHHAFRQVSQDAWTVYVDAQHPMLPSFNLFCHPSAPDISRRFEGGRAALSPMYSTTLYVTLCLSIAEKYNAIKKLLFRKSDDSSDKKNIMMDVANFKHVTNDFANMIRSTFKEVIVADSDRQLTYFHSTVSDAPHSGTDTRSAFLSRRISR